jgi:hypothetical protein
VSAPLVMALVATLCAIGAGLLVARPTRSEAAVYRHRIAATMLGAGALILFGFAWALHSWDAAMM